MSIPNGLAEMFRTVNDIKNMLSNKWNLVYKGKVSMEGIGTTIKKHAFDVIDSIKHDEMDDSDGIFREIKIMIKFILFLLKKGFLIFLLVEIGKYIENVIIWKITSKLANHIIW